MKQDRCVSAKRPPYRAKRRPRCGCGTIIEAEARLLQVIFCVPITRCQHHFLKIMVGAQ
jgi:hypothetical protein